MEGKFYPLFDSHAHYDDARFDGDRDAVIEEMHEKGVSGIVDVGCSFDTLPKAVDLAERYDFVYASAGLHPSDALAAENEPGTLDILRLYLSHEKNVALGEIGLDYHWDDVPRDIQKKWFDIQLSLARELKKPVIIHDREAHGDVMDMLRAHRDVTGILHSFSGSPEMARELVKMGWYISFSGVLTFKNAARLPEVAREVPTELMLIETDAPYLAPHPHRGERNCSLLMRYTVERLAEIKGLTTEQVCVMTDGNARRVFGIC